MTIPERKGWYVKNGPFRFPIDRPEVVDGHESIRLEPHPFYPLLHPRRRYPQRVRDYGTKDFQHLRGSNVNPHPSTCFGKVQCFFLSSFFSFLFLFPCLFIYQGRIIPFMQTEKSY